MNTLLLVLSLVFGAFISEDGSVASAALLILNGSLPAHLAVGGALLGIFLSDLSILALGRAVSHGHRVPWLRWMEPPAQQIEGARRWLTRHGVWVTILSRFLPGTRVPLCFAAGFLRIPLLRFVPVLLGAATIWSIAAVWMVTQLGAHFLERFQHKVWILLPLLAVFVLGAMLSARLGAALIAQGGTQLLRARWHRWTHFEFWPIWAAYLPVFCAVPFWTLRFGGLWSWKFSNPAIPGGGFQGESKSAILEVLAAANAPLPRWQCLPAQSPSERADAIVQFAQGSWPVVLKPDVGERGTDVAILHGPAFDPAAILSERRVLLQEFVHGEEFGIHFSRFPNEAVVIHSVHGKVFPAVVGDGVRPLRDLILAHPRGPLMWPFFAKSLAPQLDTVLAPGQHLSLTAIGNHCRGTQFVDRRDLIQPQLRAAIQQLLAEAKGFYIGRFDVRAPSADALANGAFSILELNGVTGEPGHIYDPNGSVLAGWAALLAHWHRAWRIGNALRKTPIFCAKSH